jgi:hypothetical protein
MDVNSFDCIPAELLPNIEIIPTAFRFNCFLPALFFYDAEKLQRQEQISVDSANRHDYY